MKKKPREINRFPVGAWAEPEPDLDYIEATVRACEKVVNVPSPYKTITRDDLVKRKRAGENIEPDWKEWAILPDGDPWRYLRERVGFTKVGKIVMCPRTFARSPFAKEWMPTTNGVLKILPDGYVGTIWGRDLYLDPKGRYMRVRVVANDQVVRVINLESMKEWVAQ